MEKLNDYLKWDISRISYDEKNHKYFMGDMNIPSVSSILSGSRIVQIPKGIPAIEHASHIGTETHRACQFIEEGCLDYESLDEEVKPRVDAYVKFKKEHPSRKVLFQEQLLYNAEKYYCGRADAISKEGETLYMDDIKTGRRLTLSSLLQLAAYAMCLKKECVLRLIHLKPDGTYGIHTTSGPIRVYYNDAFLYAIGVYNWNLNGTYIET